MKAFGKKLVTILLAGALLTGLMTPALAAYTTYGAVQNPTVVNHNGRTLYFYDVDDGATTNRTDTSQESDFYKAALQNNDYFKDWVSLAYNIFESQTQSHWDGDWDSDFGKGGYIDFMDCMLNQKSRWIHENWSDTNMYGYVSSGLSVAKSLKEVQERAANDIADLPNRKLTGADFLKQHSIEGLTDTEQVVLYSTVSTFDRYGSDAFWSSQIGYDSFTIAFYDFKLHVLSNEDQLAGEIIPVKNPTPESSFVTLTENYGISDISGQSTLANGTQESLSTTISNSSSYSFGEKLGVTVGGGAKIPLLAEGSMEIAGELSYGQVMETAYSETGTITETWDQSFTVTKTIPAHTKEMGQQTLAEETYKISYDCPVGLSFKVAIFSMCGTCYDDNAAVQSFSTAGYEQRSFVTYFGEDSSAPDAVESLYQRATKHPGDTTYDGTYGLTKGTTDDGDVWCTGLNWNTIIGQGAPSSNAVTDLKGGTKLTNALDDTYPMSVTGATTSVVKETITTQQGEAKPLYPIASTYISWQLDDEWSLDRTFELTVGETFPINSYRVKACDKDAVPYYGFVATKGTWKIVDADGKETSSDVAKMENDPLTGAQILTATAPGTVYVKYFIPEDTYYTWDGVASTNENITSPAYKVVVSAAPAEEPEPFAGTIEVTGSVETTVGQTENLNALLTVTACDPTGKEVEADVSWEAKELESKGITVTVDGAMTITQAGTFHVRAYADDVYSDWVEVVATEPQDLVQYICYHPFADVPHGAWYESAVEFVYLNRVMQGVKAAAFDPAGQVTRAQVAQILYNLAGKPFIVDENPFADVTEDAWYAKAVTWAAGNGLTTGVKADRFAPNDAVTREQLVTFICRYADWAGLELPSGAADLSRYEDADQISSWAKDSMIRALEAGIINGKTETTLVPNGAATRAEMAAMLDRSLNVMLGESGLVPLPTGPTVPNFPWKD